MNAPHIRLVEEPQLKSDVPDFRVGDRIEVHQKLLDGAKERVQVFEGDVIARHNGGIRETMTVRRTVQGEGVERIFPIHSPRIAKIVVKKAGKVRRAKLYYLRDRVGKAPPRRRPPRRPPRRSRPRAGCRSRPRKRRPRRRPPPRPPRRASDGVKG